MTVPGQSISHVSGRAVAHFVDDLDTDRIIPARFLKCVTFRDLGDKLFYDERIDEAGATKLHPLNDERFSGATILVTGRNFGCGSSREHAPQALVRAGFQAVVGQSFGEIFFGNALSLGLVCVSLSAGHLISVVEAIEADPAITLEIDLESQRLTAGPRRYPLEIAASAKDALLSGQWDALGLLRRNPDAVRRVVKRIPYMGW